MAGYNSYVLNDDGKPVFTPDGKPDELNGSIYVSVSNVLSVESAGDFLTRWLLSTFGRTEDPLYEYQQYMDRVSNLGTRIHSFMEADLAGVPYEGAISDDMLPAIESYLKWRRDNDVEVLDIEKILFSKKMRVAGTRDSRLRINGKVYNVDLKTGTIQSKAFVQLAAYHLMGGEMGEDNTDVDLMVLGGADSKSKLADGGKLIMHTRESWFKGRMSIEDLKFYFACLHQIWFFREMKSRKFEPIVKNMDKYLNRMAAEFRENFETLTRKQETVKPVKKGRNKNGV
jgi:hypothetical protein